MTNNSNEKTLILGVGNLLLADEGIGIRVVERLDQLFQLPENVETLDGGTLGMDLLYHLEGVKNLLIVDAVETGQPPGSVIRLEGEDVPAHMSIKMSPHQVGVPDMLFAAKLRDMYPEQIALLGVQPERIETTLELSPVVAAQLDSLVEQVSAQLQQWGISLTPKP